MSSMAAMNTETEILRTHGRGGAGNIGNDADMIIEPVVIPVSLAGASGEAFSTGRGGIGNMGNVDESRSPPAPEPTQYMAQPPDAPAPDPDIASGAGGYGGQHHHYGHEHEHHDHHSGSGSSATTAGQGLSTGRGGAGNVEADHETLGEKVEEAVGIEDHDHPRRGSKHFTAGRTEPDELTQEEIDGGTETIKRRSSNAPKDLADAGVADKLKYKIKGMLHKGKSQE